MPSSPLFEHSTEETPLNRRDFFKLAGAGLSSLLLASSGLGSLAQGAEATKQDACIKAESELGVAKRFPLIEQGIEGLSAKQIQAHLRLYEGYVKKYQSISQEIKAFTPEQLANVNATYHPFRELLVEESFALNGVLLHEEYFGILTPDAKPMSSYLKSLLNQHFGSIEAFQAQLVASAKAMRGWAILGYCPRYKHLSFYGLDSHHMFSPVGVKPVLVVDVYEHAYLIDYGTDRASYLNALWKQIDWTVVEARLSFV
ncbi:MAG: Fe-Mn family superoxide dismutase [Vampirovibrionales bacterium]|jgi:Fe-Mn family superoxide dismutase|nr:Fe-Mn family superoxide dismutase [Vampirovibrionales bacterium]